MRFMGQIKAKPSSNLIIQYYRAFFVRSDVSGEAVIVMLAALDEMLVQGCEQLSCLLLVHCLADAPEFACRRRCHQVEERVGSQVAQQEGLEGP